MSFTKGLRRPRSPGMLPVTVTTVILSFISSTDSPRAPLEEDLAIEGELAATPYEDEPGPPGLVHPRGGIHPPLEPAAAGPPQLPEVVGPYVRAMPRSGLLGPRRLCTRVMSLYGLLLFLPTGLLLLFLLAPCSGILLLPLFLPNTGLLLPLFLPTGLLLLCGE